MTINFRLVLSLLGYLITTIGILMLIPAFVDYFTQGNGASTFFVFSLLITFLGLLLAFSNKQEHARTLSPKDGLVLTLLSWISIVALAALPFKFGYLNLSYTDSYFEIMSGITTTGATVISQLDTLSYGFHLWRALIQWIGGIGIIVTAVILMPSLQGGGIQMFKIEAFETFDNAIDKAKRISIGMMIIYTFLTILVMFLLLFLGNMNFFDSIIHSLTSVSTAGFSNKDASISYFDNPVIEVILIFGMITGALPYILLYNLLFLKKSSIFKDQQVKGFIKISLLCTALVTIWLFMENGMSFLTSLRYSSFSVVSLLTGTGYISYDYSTLGFFPTMLLFSTMFIGGCAGSTACGIKIYRFQIANSMYNSYLDKMFLKKNISIPYYNGKSISYEAGTAVLVYFFLFFIIILLGSIFLSSMNLDFLTSLSAMVTCLSNVGPGLGELIGPSGNFSNLPSMAKWFLSLIMLLGRLEIFGVLIILNKKFWT